VSVLRAIARLLRALVHAIGGWLTIALLFPGYDPRRRQATVQAWALKMLRILGVEVRVEGQPGTGPLLLVANHISWLDILAMHSGRYCRFVSKAAVRRWPLVGPLTTGGGTIYIERAKRRDAMRVVHHIADSLKAGDVVAVFPEGTTGDGRTLLPFHGNMIQAAIASGTPVQPVGLRFIDRETGGIARGPSYIGDETLLGSLWRTVAGPPIVARVNFGEPQQAAGRDRRQWAADLHAAVDALRR
jgi:1-acyl-sn-glycerol-3-phosphate acyltransferase